MNQQRRPFCFLGLGTTEIFHQKHNRNLEMVITNDEPTRLGLIKSYTQKMSKGFFHEFASHSFWIGVMNNGSMSVVF